MNLHNAGDLEFPHVFRSGWDMAVCPPLYGNAHENRRLAYVAPTRMVPVSVFRLAATDPAPLDLYHSLTTFSGGTSRPDGCLD
jgi:superfamily I DNA/RNA helicase